MSVSFVRLLLPQVLLLCWLCSSCGEELNVTATPAHTGPYRAEVQISQDEKQRGAHVFSVETNTDFQLYHDQQLEWITMVSWAFQNDFDSPAVSHNAGDSLRQWRYDSSWVRRIEFAREAGFKVFFKPHLWIHDPAPSKWRSDVFPASETDWISWQESYREFILRYAKVAEAAHAEMYCIGVELTRLALEKPEFWRSLIADVRSVYTGKLTYAANWHQEYEQIDFWNELDYIGVQAYFPLTEQACPTTQEIAAGWVPHLIKLEEIHDRFNRQIVFTEMGYRSSASAAIKPWEWAENSSVLDHSYSPETQLNCYDAFFNMVWRQDWFAGAHLWQMRSDYFERAEENDPDFFFQGKPAERLIADGFTRAAGPRETID